MNSLKQVLTEYELVATELLWTQCKLSWKRENIDLLTDEFMNSFGEPVRKFDKLLQVKKQNKKHVSFSPYSFNAEQR